MTNLTKTAATEGVDLITPIPHKRNSPVLVNGNTYRADEIGVLSGVRPEDAKKLLQGKAWMEWDGRDPKQVLKEHREAQQAEQRRGHDAAVAKNQAKGIEELVLGVLHGALREMGIDPEALRAANARRTADTLAAIQEFAREKVAEQEAMQKLPAPPAALEPPKVSVPAPVPPPPATTQAEYTVPEEGEPWPDPVDDMPLDYLKLMADAYQVRYQPNIGKPKLIAKLTEAMFETDEAG